MEDHSSARDHAPTTCAATPESAAPKAVFMVVEIERATRWPIFMAALEHYDEHLRRRIFALQRRLEQVRNDAPLAPEDLREDELLLIIRRLQEQGRELEAWMNERVGSPRKDRQE